MTHSVHSLVTPAVRGAEVAVTVDGHATATVLRLVFTPAAGHTDTLDVGAFVVVRYVARTIRILDLGVIGMAADAVEARRRCERLEEGREGGECVGWRGG